MISTTTDGSLGVFNDLYSAFDSSKTFAAFDKSIITRVASILDSVCVDQEEQTRQDALDCLSRLYSEFNSFDEYYKESEYLGASASQREMKDLIARLDTLTWPIPVAVYDLVQDHFISRSAKIIYFAYELEKEFFKVQETEIMIASRIQHTSSKKFQDNPIELEDFFSILQALCIHTAFLEKICTSLCKIWIPSLALGSEFSSKRLPNGSYECALVAVDYRRDHSSALAQILKLAKFISGTVFHYNRPTAEFLNSWSSTISEVVCGMYEGEDEVASDIQDFEETLLEMEMLSQDFYPLVEHENYKEEVHCRNRLDTLMAVKDILESSDTNTVQVLDATERGIHVIILGGLQALMGRKIAYGSNGKAGQEFIDPNFSLSPLHVSVQIQSVFEIIYATLNEMTTDDPLKSKGLWNIARDCIDLIRLREAVEVGEMSAVISIIRQNDCAYVVHHLCTLAFQYRHFLKEDDHVGFLDSIPLFSKLGQAALRAEMLSQRSHISSHLNFETSLSALGDKLERNITKCINQLKSIAISWKAVMDRTLFYSAFGSLVEFAIATLAKSIVNSDEISVYRSRYCWNLVLPLQYFFDGEDTRKHVQNWILCQ